MTTLKAKFVVLAAVAAVVMSIVGCGGNTAPASGAPAPSGEPTAAPTAEATAAPTAAPAAQ